MRTRAVRFRGEVGGLPSRELTYPTYDRRKSSFQLPLKGNMWSFPGGYLGINMDQRTPTQSVWGETWEFQDLDFTWKKRVPRAQLRYTHVETSLYNVIKTSCDFFFIRDTVYELENSWKTAPFFKHDIIVNHRDWSGGIKHFSVECGCHRGREGEDIRFFIVASSDRLVVVNSTNEKWFYGLKIQGAFFERYCLYIRTAPDISKMPFIQC